MCTCPFTHVECKSVSGWVMVWMFVTNCCALVFDHIHVNLCVSRIFGCSSSPQGCILIQSNVSGYTLDLGLRSEAGGSSLQGDPSGCHSGGLCILGAAAGATIRFEAKSRGSHCCSLLSLAPLERSEEVGRDVQGGGGDAGQRT